MRGGGGGAIEIEACATLGNVADARPEKMMVSADLCEENEDVDDEKAEKRVCDSDSEDDAGGGEDDSDIDDDSAAIVVRRHAASTRMTPTTCTDRSRS